MSACIVHERIKSFLAGNLSLQLTMLKKIALRVSLKKNFSLPLKKLIKFVNIQSKDVRVAQSTNIRTIGRIGQLKFRSSTRA